MPAQDTGLAGGGGVDDAELVFLQADPELAGMFFAEALDHLGSIEATVLALESSPGDVKLLNDLFRPFHTIKGNAGALGVASVQDVAHRVESLLDLGRSGNQAIAQAEIDVILSAVDVLSAMIGGLKLRLDGQPAPDMSADSRALMDAVDRVIEEGTPAVVTGQAPPSAETASPATAPAEPAGDTTSGLVPDAVAAAHPLAWAPVAVEPVRGAVPTKTDGVRVDTVKVDTRKLDSLVDMVGELVIVQAMIQEDPTLNGLATDRLSRNLSQLKRITSDLQRNAMTMRMMPVRQTFQKMVRLVRDLGRISGKSVDLALSGEETELDRRVVEDINDPLMHMVRNSVDHGIEDPETRVRSGKPPHGRLTLSACHRGGSIVITIVDDGAGLDCEKIRAKAIAQHLIGPEQVLSDSEIHQLIFRPGFSTADTVTAISGRGVGLDVVRRNIEALRGRVEIQSTPGRGTTFVVRLPLTLAILDGLLLKSAGQRYVLPTFAVSESLQPKPDQVHTIRGRPQMIRVRDALLPLASLAELLGIDEDPRPPGDRTAVIVDDNGQRIALLVDELLGKQEVVVRALGPAFAAIRGIAGGAILADGRVGLILDAAGLTSLMSNNSARAA